MKYTAQDKQDYRGFLNSEIAENKIKVEKTEIPREQLFLNHYIYHLHRDLASL